LLAEIQHTKDDVMEMKNKIGNFGSRAFATAACVACILALRQVTLAEPADNADKVREITRRVEAAIKPSKEYSAVVHQTVKKAGAGASAAAASTRAEEVVAEEDYSVHCTIAGDARSTGRLSSRRATPVASMDSSDGSTRTIKGGLMTVNPLRAIEIVASLPAPELMEVMDQRVACFRISGRKEQFGFVVWVDKSDSSVRRVLVNTDTGVFMDTTFAYKNWGGALVPAHVEISTPSSGITMVEDFSNHAY
jgi:hypothetical protein